MKVTVTPADISAGTLAAPQSCPVALALTRALPGTRVWVGPSTVVCSNTEYDLPPKAMGFIELFDQARPVEPFEFELAMA